MRFYFSLLLLLLAIAGRAQPQSTDYEVQRTRINSLLDARSAKFGQYESSLSSKTGIFGLKTKKDMQRSIDILVDILQTDNVILRETKALLQYKDLEKSEVQTKADDSKQRIGAYMRTITQVQNHNEKLAAQVEQLEDQKSRYNLAFIALIAMMLVLFIWARKKAA